MVLRERLFQQRQIQHTCRVIRYISQITRRITRTGKARDIPAMITPLGGVTVRRKSAEDTDR